MSSILESHPIEMTPLWLNELKGEWTAHVSIYQYCPQQVDDARIIIPIRAQELTPDWLNKQLEALPSGSELALHSELTSKNKKLHIPMIDFSQPTKPSEEDLSWIEKHSNLKFNIYESGRSYHGYGEKLLTQDEWIKFMGLLLLASAPGTISIVDTRWIGHRLIAGYAALRWSKNTHQYLKSPTRII